MLVEAVLLPWGDAIVCDGLLRSTPVYLGAGIRGRLEDAYRVAKARGIVTSLRKEAATVAESKPTTAAKSPAKSARPRASKKRERSTNPKQAFVGRWRIVEMGTWDADYYEMDGPAFIEVERSGRGTFQFGLVQGELDARFSVEDGRPLMELSWEGQDEGESVCGRGRFRIEESGELRGRIFIHLADESELVARKETTSRSRRSPSTMTRKGHP